MKMNEMLRIRGLSVVVVICAIVVSGCFDYEETIEVDRDGKVTVSMISSVLESVMPFMKKRSEYKMFLAAAAGPENLKKILPEGVHVQQASAVIKDGWVHTDLKFDVDSVDSMKTTMGEMIEGQSIKWFQEEDGSYYFERIVFQPTEDDMPQDLAYQLMNNQWQKALLKFELETPLVVAETNGLALTDHRVLWSTNMAAVKRTGLRLWVRYKSPSINAGNPLWWSLGAIFSLIVVVYFFTRKKVPPADNQET